MQAASDQNGQKLFGRKRGIPDPHAHVIIEIERKGECPPATPNLISNRDVNTVISGESSNQKTANKLNVETVGIIVDDSNLYHSLKALETSGKIPSRNIEIFKAIDFCVKDGMLLFTKRFMGDPMKEEFYAYVDLMRSHGIEVITKMLKTLPDGRIKCDMDVDITMELMDAIYNDMLPDKLVLFTGDSDFESLLFRIKRERPEIKIEIITTRRALSQELRQIADVVYFLEDYWFLLKKT